MAEPSSTTAGIGIAAGAITLTGSIIGLQYDGLLFGLVGGLISLMHLPPDSPALRTKRRTAGTLGAAAFFAALLSPAAAPLTYALIAAFLPDAVLPIIASIKPDVIRLAAAGLIGLGLQFAIPLAIKFFTKRVTGEAS